MSHKSRKNPAAVLLGFESECISISLAAILPVRALGKSVKSSMKYRQIVSSIKEVGLVEPPVVARNGDQENSWLLLDGHIRVEILKDMGIGSVECLVSTDDEAFTYNKRISRLAPIQEHRMILKAIKRGVSEARIAAALNLNPRSIRHKVRLLDGICAEAIAILRDKPCPSAVFDTLRKMKTMRQIEAAELLVNANNYSVAYVSALLAGTPEAQLIETSKPKRINGITPQAVARMERELTCLQEGITSIQETYGQDHLQLTVVRAYLSRLLQNPRVNKYLMQCCPEYLTEFQSIADFEAEAELVDWSNDG